VRIPNLVPNAVAVAAPNITWEYSRIGANDRVTQPHSDTLQWIPKSPSPATICGIQRRVQLFTEIAPTNGRRYVTVD